VFPINAWKLLTVAIEEQPAASFANSYFRFGPRLVLAEGDLRPVADITTGIGDGGNAWYSGRSSGEQLRWHGYFLVAKGFDAVSANRACSHYIDAGLGDS